MLEKDGVQPNCNINRKSLFNKITGLFVSKKVFLDSDKSQPTTR